MGAGAQVDSNEESVCSDKSLSGEGIRPRGTPSLVESKMTRMPPSQALTRWTMSCKEDCNDSGKIPIDVIVNKIKRMDG